jgi:glyoxylase-like metal-dependent hydrolase (beta-lactamase superfamily II)
VDRLATVAEAEALAAWVKLHHRNPTMIYITHVHLDHFAGLSVLLRHFPGVRAIATPNSVELAREQLVVFYRKLLPGQLPAATTLPEPYPEKVFHLESHELHHRCRATPTPQTAPPCTCPRSSSSSGGRGAWQPARPG